MTIDSHQHFWQYEPEKHSWIDDEMAAIRRDFTPEDLIQELTQNGVEGCVAVQADQTETETDFLIDLASKNNFIKGIVGWVDLRSTTVEESLEKYATVKKVKGFRHVVQGEPDHNFLLRPAFLNGIAALEKHHFSYDILIFPHQLGAALELVSKFPNQKFVIDHLAKPYIKDGFFNGWATLMKAFAKHENIFCKVSGMITEADYNNWTKAQLAPYLDVVFEAFGSRRILFGSDWPVCLVAGSYAQVKAIVTDYIADFSSEEQKNIMGHNAMKFYNL